MIKALSPWIIASRLKTLPAAISPVLVGSALAYSSINEIQISIFLSIILASIFIQIGTNLSNDLSDFTKGTDNEERLGPVRAAQTGLLTINQLKLGIIISFGLAIFFGIYLVSIGGYIIVLIGVFSIISGILYTAGPFPLGYNGLGDFFVFIFFGIIAVSGTFYLHTLIFNSESLICGIMMGSLSTSILVVNNIRDANTDVKTGKKTLAVILGIKFSKIEFSVLVLLPFCLIIYLYLLINKLAIFLSFFTLPIALHLVYQIYHKTGSDLNNILFKAARLLFVFSLLLSLGLIV